MKILIDLYNSDGLNSGQISGRISYVDLYIEKCENLRTIGRPIRFYDSYGGVLGTWEVVQCDEEVRMERQALPIVSDSGEFTD